MKTIFTFGEITGDDLYMKIIPTAWCHSHPLYGFYEDNYYTPKSDE